MDKAKLVSGQMIYVADESPEVRQMIEDFLLRCDPNWKATGFNRPGAVVEACRQRAPDAVLMDLGFADRSGARVLEEIRAVAPSSLRIVMTVHLESRAQSTPSSAHQFLFKPFVFSELSSKLRRGFQAQSGFPNAEVRERVLSLRGLPSMPRSYDMVVSALQENRGHLGAVVDPLGRDAGLSTSILRFANSPLFGTHVVSDLMEAVMVLGTERLKAIVVSQEVMKRYGAMHEPLKAEDLWNHSCHTAALAKRFGERAKLSQEQCDVAFLGALLHNTGRFVLLENYLDAYQKALSTPKSHESLSSIERSLLHVSGEEVTGFLLQLWGMAQPVVEASAYHERPWDEPGAGEFSPTTAVYLANHFAHELRSPDGCGAAALNETYLQQIGLPATCSLDELREDALALQATNSALLT